jgi:hypothetical protein
MILRGGYGVRGQIEDGVNHLIREYHGGFRFLGPTLELGDWRDVLRNPVEFPKRYLSRIR